MISELTRQQHDEAVYNFYHNDCFDHVLLDERMPDGTIVTVVRYDEETVIVWRREPEAHNEFPYKKYSNQEFLRC